ncbi:MAG: universal stress protein [Acidimicrobiia bacterium]|nr:universal stress protein [Acidimicrobiia bacterium]
MAERAKSFTRLLVHFNTTTTSQPAFRRALALARTTRASIRLVDVLPQLPAPGGQSPPFARLVRDKMLDQLAEAVAETRRWDIPVTSALLEGDEASALIQAAVAWRADVLMRSHGVHGPAAIPAGPIDSQVLRRCPCPVWLVTPRSAEEERVVVAAVDPEPQDAPRHELSVRVARTAMQFAAQTGATLHLVHAWTAFGHQILAGRATSKDLLAHYAACRDHERDRAGDAEDFHVVGAFPKHAAQHVAREQADHEQVNEPLSECRAHVEAAGRPDRHHEAGATLHVFDVRRFLHRCRRVTERCRIVAGSHVQPPEGLQDFVLLGQALEVGTVIGHHHMNDGTEHEHQHGREDDWHDERHQRHHGDLPRRVNGRRMVARTADCGLG